MATPFSLTTLLNLAEHHSDSATRKLGQLNQQEYSAQQQLEILLEFRRDYQAQMQKDTEAGMSPAALRNFQQFIYKLDEAIAQQRRQLENSKASTQLGRDEFDVTQRKLKSLDTLRQRHIETQKQIANKAEQKELDEHTGRMAARRMSDELNQAAENEK
ncbi:MAG TPA: flagellar export protein FliJ [Gallionella sp.]|nr:flagellar export protein FliJ [Gallionella sp.]